MKVIGNLFKPQGNSIEDQRNPFVLVQGGQNEGKKKWITTLDLAFLTLFSLYMLIEECWKNNILLIGVAKDTAAQEFKNHVIPICTNNNIWRNCKITKKTLIQSQTQIECFTISGYV
jgi:hypothetical protein